MFSSEQASSDQHQKQTWAAARKPSPARSNTPPSSPPQSSAAQSAASAPSPAQPPARAPRSRRSAAFPHGSPEIPRSFSFATPPPLFRLRLLQQGFNFRQFLRRRLPQRQHRLHQLIDRPIEHPMQNPRHHFLLGGRIPRHRAINKRPPLHAMPHQPLLLHGP